MSSSTSTEKSRAVRVSVAYQIIFLLSGVARRCSPWREYCTSLCREGKMLKPRLQREEKMAALSRGGLMWRRREWLIALISNCSRLCDPTSKPETSRPLRRQTGSAQAKASRASAVAHNRLVVISKISSLKWRLVHKRVMHVKRTFDAARRQLAAPSR